MPTPGCPDDRRKATEIRQALDLTVTRASQTFMRHLAQARERLSHVAARQRLWEARAAEPVPEFQRQNARILARFYGAQRRQLEIEAQAAQANLAVAGADGLPDAAALRVPEDDPAYQLARRQADFFLAVFLWRAEGEGIDAALRATGRAGAIQAQDPAEVAALAARAEGLRTAAAADPELARHLAWLAGELVEAEALLGWAQGKLKALDGFEADWEQLAEKLAVLRSLRSKSAAWPALAALFQEPDPVALR